MGFLHRKHDTAAGLPPGYVTAGSLGRSPNGTPLNQILHVDVSPDIFRWIPIPITWAGYWSSPEQWAQDWAPDIWGLWVEKNPGVEKPEQSAIDRTAVELCSYAEKWGGFDPLRPFEIATWLHLPSPTVGALPVRVFVDDTPDLTIEQAAVVDTSDAIPPPTVEQFHTEILGAGLKVTCHGTLDPPPGDLPGAQTVWVQVRYAFASRPAKPSSPSRPPTPTSAG
ncbi:MAG TPA: hypothetical protein VHV82_16955 [Sporichthyaceae bacterium]|nr:hypothetical protein [Sporichthyaceae bacterium]